jgi:hypothetical protein
MLKNAFAKLARPGPKASARLQRHRPHRNFDRRLTHPALLRQVPKVPRRRILKRLCDGVGRIGVGGNELVREKPTVRLISIDLRERRLPLDLNAVLSLPKLMRSIQLPGPDRPLDHPRRARLKATIPRQILQKPLLRNCLLFLPLIVEEPKPELILGIELEGKPGESPVERLFDAAPRRVVDDGTQTLGLNPGLRVPRLRHPVVSGEGLVVRQGGNDPEGPIPKHRELISEGRPCTAIGEHVARSGRHRRGERTRQVVQGVVCRGIARTGARRKILVVCRARHRT